MALCSKNTELLSASHVREHAQAQFWAAALRRVSRRYGMLPQLPAPDVNFGRKVGYASSFIPQDADPRYICVEHSLLGVCLGT